MKSLKDYSLNLSEKDYHAYPAWSYSLIARYAKEGFSSIATLHTPIKPTPSMEFGSLVDCMVTRGDFNKEYIVSDTVPPPAEKNVLDTLLSMTNVPFYDIPTSTMQDAIIACNYQSRLKYDTQYSKIEAQHQYYDDRRAGKKIVSTEDYSDAVAVSDALKNNERIGKYFGEPGRNGNTEYIYQAQFIAKMKIGDDKVMVKIMPDLLIVDHDMKIVYPIDLKTSSVPSYDFAENFVKFRYDIQASVYTDVLRVVMNSDEDYKNYMIWPYTFIDISRTDKIPLDFGYNPKDESQVDGLSFKDYKYKGWRDLLWEILEYERTEAKVPKHISTEHLNDIVTILNSQR